jgi:hypothetical protein
MDRAGDAAADPANPPVSGEQIHEEHRHLRELLERIAATRELEPLLTLLGELSSALEVHFEHEESPGGLHDVIDASAPHLLGRVDELFDEHRRCLEELARLRSEARTILDGPVAEVIRGVDALCRMLHEHEAAETEILSESLYDELGGSG